MAEANTFEMTFQQMLDLQKEYPGMFGEMLTIARSIVDEAPRILNGEEENPRKEALEYYERFMKGFGNDKAFDYHGSYVIVCIDILEALLLKQREEQQ